MSNEQYLGLVAFLLILRGKVGENRPISIAYEGIGILLMAYVCILKWVNG